MIDMRMGEEHIVYQRFLHRQFAVFKHVRPLLHTVVHQNILIAYTKIMAAPCHLMVCPDKHKFHTVFPPAHCYHVYYNIFSRKRKSFRGYLFQIIDPQHPIPFPYNIISP